MKKVKNYLLLLLVLFLPTTVYASPSDTIPLIYALGMEAFVSIHMSIFFLLPLSKIISKENSKKTFWKLFGLRVGILLFFDFFITPSICILDFIMVFIGTFVIMPIMMAKNRNNGSDAGITNIDDKVTISELKCSKCGSVINSTDKFCGNCGEACTSNIAPKKFVSYYDFDPIYKQTDEKVLEDFILLEFRKADVDINSPLIPEEILKRKKIMLIIFSILIFVYVSLIFFHFPLLTYIIGLIILIILFKYTNRYDLMKYLKKEIKARPNEKISNIVMNIKNSFVADNSRRTLFMGLIVAIILPLVIFINPRIMYEKVTFNNVDGYAVRFYTFGLTNFTSAVIPESYNGKNVISLRGNTFSNMPFLKRVDLPDTILEIRGQAFKNDRLLKKVNIPKNLEYLGGGAFYNCRSIESIELPDTLSVMGGETFYGADNLKYIKLSNNLTEIRGSSFEECAKLESIKIPDKVTRIGGHAFYDCINLNKVEISANSELKEIGSSAFRKCYKLYEISIPKDTLLNERAFKGSPTNVYRFGELRYGEIIDKTKYLHNNFKYLSVNQYVEVTVINSSLLYGHKIGLDNVSCYNGECSYTIIYDDGISKTSAVLTKDQPYAYVTDDLAIEISSKYQLNNQTSASINVYFN